MEPQHTAEVREFYEHNTPRFLQLGKHGGSLNIHQALWAEDVQDQEAAVSYSNALVLRELQQLALTFPGQTLQVLDLGCGVGSSLFYLAQHWGEKGAYHGITLSPLQARIANERRKESPQGNRCEVQAADFLHLPDLPDLHFAYAIEAFVHAADPARFFQQIGQRLLPGGTLVLIDDGLTEAAASEETLSPRSRQWLRDFRAGWLAQSLIGLEELETLAGQAGLELVAQENLTPYMDLGRPRDRLIGAMIRLAGPWMRRSTYFKALTGGYAKQQCLKHGLVAYQKLVLRKVS